MAEPIDLEQLARRILDKSGELNPDAHAVADIHELLRQVWNARGAADIATLEHELAQQMGATASGPYTKNLDRALRKLDR